MKLKVAIIQINSLLGQPQQNIKKVQSLLSNISNNNSRFADLVVFSELALTGYNFSSSLHIKPHLESITNYGVSLNFAKNLSIVHQCFTVIGYPEIFNGKIYNSAALFNRNGELIHNYRKTFLYETDEVWGCNENPVKGFPAIDVDFSRSNDKTPMLVTTNFGICMDLNPYKFEADFNEFEFSCSCYSSRSRLIICPMAWLSPKSPSTNTELTEEEKIAECKQIELPSNEPCQSTINYWILRFFPFLTHKNSFMPKWWNKSDKVTVICCNRVGKEKDIVYGGSSCILQFLNNGIERSDLQVEYEGISQQNPSVLLLDTLSQSEEGIILREIEL
ncbi:NTA1 [Candida oxycetoniae]|uniref:NTA1 n=1 Tax=Candida oxycetoniae TaxID=497107 RepID=A0AAI9SWS5_9ASCO|nr:NTA1 [Candida oxycetoniae]KAI3404397.2 NTA1 [Candida oxycetoniae]